MVDVDNEGNKNNQVKDKSTFVVKESQKRPIEVTNEKTSTMLDKLSKIINKEMVDVDNEGNKNNQVKDKSTFVVKESQKRPIEVTNEKTSTMLDKLSSKKVKKK
ncbi:hypothetical protein Glove_258g24 [Diversispora epigaea]|uniref:Uncharacterized protein n=1 Tax=Diversispora epigaea TaxID=1348612 RepID=A0A397I773_9GLOM|nr:hypothetical protein Glove_258g24 [Diversispora epigaea]